MRANSALGLAPEATTRLKLQDRRPCIDEMTDPIRHFFVAACVLACFAANPAAAQTEQEKLQSTILEKDARFWKAYNNCETDTLKDFFTDDVEFYHDKGGPTIGLQALADSIKTNLCGNAKWRLRREVVPGSVRVFPLSKGATIYGAILSGEHVFYVTELGKPEFLDGRANFTHVWLINNGEFKMARILSYNHHAVAPPK
jgi:hypothetical protein